MIAYGQIGEILRDLNGGWRLSFTIDQLPEAEEMQALTGKQLEITARLKRERRTLDANAYYWVLVSKLAKAVGTSNARMHNLIMRSYGTPEEIDGEIVTVSLPESDAAEDKALEAETFHLKPTAEIVIGDYGKVYRTYILMRPSHEMDRREFSALINGLVEECKVQGIETLPPEELERMMQAWQKA